MPKKHDDNKDQPDQPDTADESKHTAETFAEVPAESAQHEDTTSEPCKWQAQLKKEQEKENKKEVEVDEAYDKGGFAIRLGTRIIVNDKHRIVTKLTNKTVSSIPVDVTEENEKQTLAQVTLEHPYNEVSRY
jgi:hypothetical protein